MHSVPDADHELLLGERLDDVVPGALVEELHQQLLVGLRREQHDRRRLELRRLRIAAIISTPLTFGIMMSDTISVGRNCSAFSSPSRPSNAETTLVLARQALDDEAVHVGIVFDDEHARPAAGPPRRARRGCRSRWVAACANRSSSMTPSSMVAIERARAAPARARGQPDVRDRDGEARAAERGSDHLDRALVHLDEFLGDGQSQAGARRPCG